MTIADLKLDRFQGRDDLGRKFGYVHTGDEDDGGFFLPGILRWRPRSILWTPTNSMSRISMSRWPEISLNRK